MADYSVGIITRDKILETCKFLFFKYGVEDTTYKMICESANVNRGLIPYHFKTKYNIAQTIYEELLSEYEDWINKIFPLAKFELCVQFCCSSMLLYRLICSNEKFMKFYYDIKNARELNPASFKIQQHIIQNLMEYYDIKLSPSEITTLTCMFTSIETGLINGVYNKTITEGPDLIVKKDMNFVLSSLEFDQEKVHNYFDSAMALTKGYSIEMGPSFKLMFNEPL